MTGRFARRAEEMLLAGAVVAVVAELVLANEWLSLAAGVVALAALLTPHRHNKGRGPSTGGRTVTRPSWTRLGGVDVPRNVDSPNPARTGRGRWWFT